MLIQGSKIKLIKLWEIINSETDEKHPISTKDLLSRLEREGIKCSRKTLYSDINLLNSFGYEILKEKTKRNNYYIIDREFSDDENLPIGKHCNNCDLIILKSNFDPKIYWLNLLILE